MKIAVLSPSLAKVGIPKFSLSYLLSSNVHLLRDPVRILRI